MFDWMKDENNDKLLVILRGVPSSGKSTRAKELSGNDPSVIHSADSYFGATNEEYVANWNLQGLFEAHKACKKSVRMAMQRQSKLVIVDNTNTMFREIFPYFSMAVQYGYKVQIEEPTSPWWVNDIAPYLNDKKTNRKQLEKMAKFLFEKSKLTHCVPLSSIEKMLFRYQPNITFDDLAKCYTGPEKEED